MKIRRSITALLGASILALIALPLTSVSAQESSGVEASYHGQLGYGTGLGMLEKWCALPNFSYYQQEGIDGWTDINKRDCSNCHIGAQWNLTRNESQCDYCHSSATPGALDDEVTIAGCMNCHKKDKAKRGVDFRAVNDVHIAAGYLCQDCHLKVDDDVSDHQFLKGTAIDTTEPTLMGTLSCTSACHEQQPHAGGTDKAAKLNAHTAKVACETCHTGLRPNKALASRQWNVFTAEGKPLTTWRDPGWLPDHKWYDNTGPGASGDGHLPILTHTERRGLDGAKIYPFNTVTVDWFVKKKNSDFDEVIIAPEVKAADANGDGTVTTQEMRQVYRKATLKSADMNFSISHSVAPAEEAFQCNDCHGRHGYVLNWDQLGYSKDPNGGSGKGKKPK